MLLFILIYIITTITSSLQTQNTQNVDDNATKPQPNINTTITNNGLNCIPNDMVHDMKIVNPIQSNYVENMITVSGSLFCYNPEKCKNLINIWYLCVSITPNYNSIDNQYLNTIDNNIDNFNNYTNTICTSMFDDIAIEMLPNITEQIITMSLCSDEQGCVCKHEIDIKCCIKQFELEEIDVILKFEKINYMKEKLKLILEYPSRQSQYEFELNYNNSNRVKDMVRYGIDSTSSSSPLELVSPDIESKLIEIAIIKYNNNITSNTNSSSDNSSNDNKSSDNNNLYDSMNMRHIYNKYREKQQFKNITSSANSTSGSGRFSR